MKYLSYSQAAEKLGIESVATLRTAASRGSLTKVPTNSPEALLVEEQVNLFKGKKQIRYTLLSDEEKETWNKCRKRVSEIQKEQIIVDEITDNILIGQFTESDAKNINQQIRLIGQIDPKLAFTVSMLFWSYIGLWPGQTIIRHDEMADMYHRAFPNGTEADYRRYRMICIGDDRVIEFTKILEGYPQTYTAILPKLLEIAKTLDLEAIAHAQRKQEYIA